MTNSTVSPLTSEADAGYPRHYAEDLLLSETPAAVFDYIDDYRNLARHMERPSWRMAWATMTVASDEAQGRAVGSTITMAGRFLGLRLSLTEAVECREPPRLKSWMTTEEPSLVVMGNYRITVTAAAEQGETRLRVALDYALPRRHRWLGHLFGRTYAKWCVNPMLRGAERHFDSPKT